MMTMFGASVSGAYVVMSVALELEPTKRGKDADACAVAEHNLVVCLIRKSVSRCNIRTITAAHVRQQFRRVAAYDPHDDDQQQRWHRPSLLHGEWQSQRRYTEAILHDVEDRRSNTRPVPDAFPSVPTRANRVGGRLLRMLRAAAGRGGE